MSLEKLPDDVLQQIFLKCNAKDVESLRVTNRRLYEHISYYRLHYRKFETLSLDTVLKKNDQIMLKAEVDNSEGKKEIKFMSGLMDYHVKSLNPEWIIMHDHDELVNMSQMWWKDRRKILLHGIIDYQRYLPYFDRCQAIILDCDSQKNLTEILKSMKTKNKAYLKFGGSGELKCADEDLRTIAKLSNNMSCLELDNLTDDSNVSNEAILDMIENGSFHADSSYVRIFISRVPNFSNMSLCASQRDWVAKFTLRSSYSILLKSTDSGEFLITRKVE